MEGSEIRKWSCELNYEDGYFHPGTEPSDEDSSVMIFDFWHQAGTTDLIVQVSDRYGTPLYGVDRFFVLVIEQLKGTLSLDYPECKGYLWPLKVVTIS